MTNLSFRIMSSLVLPSLLVLLNICIPLPASAEEVPPFVPAEVMVKFTAGSEAEKALTRATSAKLEPLMPTVQHLTAKLGIPLRAKQILSGGWLLLAIDLDKLAQQVADQLQKSSAVVGVEVKAKGSKGLGMPEPRLLEVTFRPDSAEAKIIQDRLSGAADGSFSRLVDNLAKQIALPLLAKPAPVARLSIEIDLPELTLRLSNQLKTLSELIESVDLNHITTIR